VTGAIPDDPNAEFWKKLTPNNIPLMGQVIVDPRNFNPAIDLVAVRAAYNDKEIVFHLTWDDPTQSADEPTKKLFADAIALQFPPQITAGPERPYFLMGDGSDAVYLLRWENGKGVSEASANGPGKIAAIAGGEARGKRARSCRRMRRARRSRPRCSCPSRSRRGTAARGRPGPGCP